VQKNFQIGFIVLLTLSPLAVFAQIQVPDDWSGFNGIWEPLVPGNPLFTINDDQMDLSYLKWFVFLMGSF
jgi:hypothetical protein